MSDHHTLFLGLSVLMSCQDSLLTAVCSKKLELTADADLHQNLQGLSVDCTVYDGKPVMDPESWLL